MSSTSAPVAPSASGLDRYFGISRRGSSIAQEIRGGLVTFFTMAYIIALNPLIIGTTADKNGNLISGLSAADPANIPPTIAMVAAATSLVAGIMTITMGLVGRYPLALATGLGLNAMLAYVVAPQVTWAQAMGLIVWEGIIILVLVLTGFREAVFRAVPRSLRTGIAVGIGLFIALVGFADAGVVRQGSGTPLTLGVGGNLMGWPVLLFVVGLLVLVLLYVRRVRGAMLIAIVGMTVVAIVVEAALGIGGMTDDNPVGWALNVPALTGSLFSLPDLSLLGRIDMFGAFTAGPQVTVAMLMTVFALLLADFFDTMGTIVAVGAEGGLLDSDGNPERVREILVVDSIAAIAGGVGSVSSNTSYIESAAGVGEGARTGFASVVTGIAFLLSLFLAPLVKLVPSEAAAPALVFVGFLMLSQVIHVDWSDPEEGFPAFITMVVMPFSYSITAGLGAGFIFHVLIKVARGKAKEIHPLLWGVAVAFLLYFSEGVLGALIA